MLPPSENVCNYSTATNYFPLLILPASKPMLAMYNIHGNRIDFTVRCRSIILTSKITIPKPPTTVHVHK